jgi:hypothetical protein
VIRAGPSATVLVLGLLPAVLVAQATTGVGVAAVAVASDPWFVGGGLQSAFPLGDLMRVSALGAIGTRAGAVEGRGELSLQLVFDPTLTKPVTWYAGGGLALRAGSTTDGFLLLVGGIEGRGRGRDRWWIETGVGGGARFALGYRWHRAPKKSGRSRP